MTTSKPNLLELAKQGNPKAIAVLMNRKLQPQGVTAKAALKEGCLQVILEAEQVPDRGLVTLVQKGITTLGVASVHSVKVYGRQIGGDFIGWSEKFEISKRTLANEVSDKGSSQSPTSISNNSLWRWVKTLSEESGLVYSLSTSPSGNILASGTGKNTVKVWNLRTEKIVHTLRSSAEYSYCVAVSPDGQILASSGSDTTINVKNLKTGLLVRDLGGLFSGGHSGYVHSLAFSSDSQLLASGSSDNTIKIWDLKTGQTINTLSGHTGCVHSLAISQDDNILISGSGDHTIKLWSLKTGKLVRTLSGHSDAVYSVAISSDGQTLASGSFDKTIRVWNLKDSISQTESLVWASPTGDSHIYSVAINYDGKTLASMNGNNIIQLWDLETGKLLQTLADHTLDSWSSGLLTGLIGILGFVPVTVHFGSDEDTLISAAHGKIRVWEREPVTSKRTAKYYEKLINEQTSLLLSANILTPLDEQGIYNLAKFFLSFISSDEELIDVFSVRYKGENSYLVITNKQLICLTYQNFTATTKKFSHRLDKVQNASLGNNGLSWLYGNSEFRAYFNAGKPNNKVSSIISFSNVASIPNDEFEQQYQRSGLFAGCGCLTVLAALIMWGFSSCVGAVFQQQPSPQLQVSQPSAPSAPSTPSNDRTFLGSGPTGYTLWRGSNGCIYVKNLTQGDLSRMNVSISELKQVIKEQTGSQCVFFE